LTKDREALLTFFRETPSPESASLGPAFTGAAALSAGRTGKCPVIVAKLDRLSRDVAFIAGLMA
jgi:hypothetical protein